MGEMKWPSLVGLIRHVPSKFNQMGEEKKSDPLYQSFIAAYEVDYLGQETRRLAEAVMAKYRLDCGDHNTPATDLGYAQAAIVGHHLPEFIDLPETVFLSPHDRAIVTYEGVCNGWPELRQVRTVIEPRLREQEHGQALLYNDWRVFHVMHPEQKRLFDMEGPYYYKYPQGENMPNVIDRAHSLIGTFVRSYSNMPVLCFTHHRTILAYLAAMLRWDHREFMEWNENRKPQNTSLTVFRGDPGAGENGRMVLQHYNKVLYTP